MVNEMLAAVRQNLPCDARAFPLTAESAVDRRQATAVCVRKLSY